MLADALLGWLAPILSTLVICAGQLMLNARFKQADEKRDAARAETQAKRAVESEWHDTVDRLLSEQNDALKHVAEDRVDWYAWRDEVVSLMDRQDERIETILRAQCSQTRSDIIHKCHRYLDDLGRASTEEKEALSAEHEEYTEMCEANDIVNHFVDGLVQRVMELPERDLDTPSGPVL